LRSLERFEARKKFPAPHEHQHGDRDQDTGGETG
jgi:hypothetical protein